MSSEAELLERVHQLVHDQEEVVSYKCASRQFELPSNHAKQLLYQYVQTHPDDVVAVYFVAGWTHGAAHLGPEGKLRTMELVPGSKLQERRDAMSAVSCVHVYSVQRRLPDPPAALLDHDKRQQCELLADASRPHNPWSHVRFPQVKRIAAPPRTAVAVAAPTTAPVKKKETEAAKPAAPAPAAPKPAQEEKKKGGIPLGGSGGTAVTGKARMASLFAKAPAAKPKAKPAATAPAARKRLAKPAAVAGDAEAALAMEEGSDSDADDMVVQPARRRRACAVMDDDDDDEEAEAEEDNEGAAAELLQEGQVEDDGMQEDAPPSGARAASRKAEEQAAPQPAAKRTRPAEAGGRTRVVKTTMDDKGRETTQVVYVDAAGNEYPTATGGHSTSTSTSTAAASTAAASPSPAAAAKAASPKRSPKAAASPKAEKEKEKEKAAPKAAPKGKGKKAAAANTKGIASFFGKK